MGKKMIENSEEMIEFIEDHIQNEIHKAVEKTKKAQMKNESINESVGSLDLPLYDAYGEKISAEDYFMYNPEDSSGWDEDKVLAEMEKWDTGDVDLSFDPDRTTAHFDDLDPEDEY